MFRKVWFLTLLIAYSSACVFGAGKKHNKRSQGATPWFRERESHVGADLSNKDLEKVSLLGDEKHFFDTLKPILIPRVVDTPGHTAVREFIIEQMEQLGWTVESHAFDDTTPLGPKTFTNVIATLKPSATRRLVIACHYDSKLTPEGFLGATDSAVPCAMMINLAHVMRNYLNEHNRKMSNLTLQFIFIDGEEAFVKWSDKDSLYGARNLANRLHSTPFPLGGVENISELHRIDLFVLLDLLGTKDCGFYSYFPQSERWYSQLLRYEKNMTDLKYINQRSPMFRNQRFYRAGIEDDHVPFLKKGVPILHLISAPFPSVWHEMTDNFDALHPPSIENLNTILRAFVAHYLQLAPL